MQYPYPNYHVCTPTGTVALDSRVQAVVNAIRSHSVIPYGDYGGPTVYYFSTLDNGLGNLVYTVFDRETTLGLASFMVRYGAAATINQVLFQPFPRCQIELQYLLLPRVDVQINNGGGSVIP